MPDFVQTDAVIPDMSIIGVYKLILLVYNSYTYKYIWKVIPGFNYSVSKKNGDINYMFPS